MSRRTQYKVYITPRINDTEYGDQVDVSDRVKLGGIPAITVSLDAGDYDVGVFTYSDLTIQCANEDGFFNEASDSRSMFLWYRDLAKVEVVFFQELDISTITFRGILSDDATRIMAAEEKIEFRVLSRDSVIRDAVIATGDIATGINISEAIYLILNSDEITRVLNVAIGDISVPNDLTIDDGSAFDGMDKRSALNSLLLAGNAVMLIDEDDNISVTSRDESNVNQPLRLYGPGDLRGRENIIDLDNYNNGLHRVVNVMEINDRVTSDLDSINDYGAKKKSESMSFFTTNAKADAVALALVTEFKIPKIELSVTVDTELAKDYTLLDRVIVDYGFRYYPAPGARIPVCGAFISDEATTPYIQGSVVIPPTATFKIIEKIERPQNFQTTLKLRQIGVTLQDGYS